MKKGEKVPEHLKKIDKIREIVDSMTPKQRCAAAGYHMLIDGKCQCGFIEDTK